MAMFVNGTKKDAVSLNQTYLFGKTGVLPKSNEHCAYACYDHACRGEKGCTKFQDGKLNRNVNGHNAVYLIRVEPSTQVLQFNCIDLTKSKCDLDHPCTNVNWKHLKSVRLPVQTNRNWLAEPINHTFIYFSYYLHEADWK
jgi:hypothetical protein